jgi:hypothetical protein
MVLFHLVFWKVCSVATTLCALLAGYPWEWVVGFYVAGVFVGLLASALLALEADRPVSGDIL